MPRFAANLSTMYGEHAFPERFAAARADGFHAVEAQWIHDYPAQELRQRLETHRLSLVLFNAPAGDSKAGEKGLAALPGRQDDFFRAIETALEIARISACPRFHVLSGIVPAGVNAQTCRDTLIENLSQAVPLAAQAGVTLLIEPINPRDMPGYFLNRQADAHAICRDVRERTGLDAVKVQMDLYHCQIVEGGLAFRLRQYIDDIGHIQIAGVPSRHEPDCGEVNYPYLFQLIDELEYSGWVGCEYSPRGGTRAGLGWLKELKP